MTTRTPWKIGNVLNWATTVEQNTLDQAQMTARLPFLAGHLALMPDAHYGFGSTVGSVIPTVGAIVPAAIGVDIGCVDADTEYLSRDGWRRIADYDGGDVMIFDSNSDTGWFSQPSAFIKRESGGFLHFKTKYGIDQMLSPDHRVLCERIVGRDRRRDRVVVSARDLASDHARLAMGAKVEFVTTFTPMLDGRVAISDEDLRVMVMVMADGHFDPRRPGRGVAIRLKKERKIARAIELLNAAGRTFTKYVDGDGVTRLSFEAPIRTKTYADFWSASLTQLQVITDEALHWDGNIADRCFFTRDEPSADFMQYAFTATGRRAVLRLDGVDYRVHAHDRTAVGLAGVPKSPVAEVRSADGFEYCFTVETGFWVMRRGGNVAMTGNCGMAAIHLDVDSSALGDDLSGLHDAIRQAIPAGLGKAHLTPNDRYGSYGLGLPPSTEVSQRQSDKIVRQLGSLGGGNHFVEVCLDEHDDVWLMLHSGSRGIGKELAEGHVDKAKGLMKQWFIELEHPDLAYFPEHTPEFDAYIADMLWAQNYAMANRTEMLAALVGVVLGDFRTRGVTPRSGGSYVLQTVNCHHNFTEMEHHHGRNMWVTRKGAIRARDGEFGIIPGSMGTRSYIVAGKGSAASYCSCSHGAGRRLGRKAAERTLTVDSLREAMRGRTWDADKADQLVDEHPLAYKDIDEVMADQADLVSVVATLRQVLNYKGTE